MGECEYIKRCPFFNGTLNVESLDSERVKKEYCESNNLHCARYMVLQALGPENMVEDLLPEEKTRAYMVIAEG